MDENVVERQADCVFSGQCIYLYIHTNMPTKIQKWGNSLAMRLPKEITDKLNLREGSEIKIVHKSKNIVIRPVRIGRKKEKLPTLNELASKITKNNKHPLIDWVSPVGKEIW